MAVNLDEPVWIYMRVGTSFEAWTLIALDILKHYELYV